MAQADTPETPSASPTAKRGDDSRNFHRYWAATAVSGTGSAVSGVVIPLLAATVLGATAGQMAILAALAIVPAILLQVVVASRADATTASRVRVMVVADLFSGLLIGLVPLLWWAGSLTLPFLFAVMAAKAVTGVFRNAYAAPVAVQVIPRGDLVRANGRLNGTRSATDIVGQGLGGALLAVLSAPFALIVDAVSFLASAALAGRIRLPVDKAAADAPAPTGPAEPGSPVDPSGPSGPSDPGLKAIAGRLLRRTEVWCLVAIALANGVTEAVFVLFCVRTVAIPPSAVGLLLALGAVGGILGGFLTGRAARLFGRWTVVVGCAATVWSLLPLLMVGQGLGAWAAVVNFELAGAFGGTLVMAVVFGELQGLAARDGTVARTMAVATTSIQLASLLGLLIGGLAGDLLSHRWALGTGTALLVLLSAPLAARLLTSPGRTAPAAAD
ncbi:MFS transporter [Kitasatospora sp. NPDC096147]|uniref:MFS transporter n=1 Tax=Kitasatospora sp. NPDC096147 TaxID=3364093 RepID=UPI00381B1AD9